MDYSVHSFTNERTSFTLQMRISPAKSVPGVLQQASITLFVERPVWDSIISFYLRSTKISFPHHQVVVASHPLGIADSHMIGKTSFLFEALVFALKNQTNNVCVVSGNISCVIFRKATLHNLSDIPGLLHNAIRHTLYNNLIHEVYHQKVSIGNGMWPIS